MRRIICLLIISLLLTGCSGNQAVLPDSSQDTIGLKSPEKTGTISSENRTGEAEKASSETDHPVLPAASSPVIVQSAPEPTGNADAVLDDINQELDNLTDILNGMEEPDTAWVEEVKQQ
ncbi:MAG: hypothetical protein ACM3NT_08985 [Methylocystaceae bacterium]